MRKSAKTRSWEKAEELKRQWEEAETPRKAEPVTIEKAVESYLADAKARELREATIWKLETIFRKQFLGLMPERGAGQDCLKHLPPILHWNATTPSLTL